MLVQLQQIVSILEHFPLLWVVSLFSPATTIDAAVGYLIPSFCELKEIISTVNPLDSACDLLELQLWGKKLAMQEKIIWLDTAGGQFTGYQWQLEASEDKINPDASLHRPPFPPKDKKDGFDRDFMCVCV